MVAVAAVDWQVVLAPCVIAVALFGLVTGLTADRRLWRAFALAIGAGLALTLAAFVMSLCSLGGSGSLAYESRCESGVPWWPLVGIPVLLGLASTAARADGRVLLVAGASVFLASLAVPWFWLTAA